MIELADLPGHPARLIARRHKAMLETQLADRPANAGGQNVAERARELAREIWLLSAAIVTATTGLAHGHRPSARLWWAAAVNCKET